MDGRVACPLCGAWNIPGVDVCRKCDHSLADMAAQRPLSRVEQNLFRDRLQTLSPSTPMIVAPDATVCEVLQLLVHEQIGCVLIMEDGQLQGIFSERDALLKLGANVAEHAYTPISEFMTTNVETLEYDDSIVFALYKMDLGGFRHIPLYRDGQVSGIVSVRDFLRYIADELLAT